MQKQSAVKEAIRALLAAEPHTRKQLKKLAKASASQITKKLNELRDEVGIIQFRRDGEDWFQLPSPGITKYAVRKQQNKDLKEEIGKCVFDLILGPSDETNATKETALIESSVLAVVGPETRANLLSIYARRERTVILDGGSTNYYVAERLKTVSLPSERYRLWRLLIVTNCPPIAECLYEAPTGPDVALIGGRVSRDTRSISGHLAESAIREWDIEADFSIVGAGGLDLPRGFCNFSEEEAAVKALLLSRGRVKFVAMDSSKVSEFGAGRPGLTFCFAPASNNAIDVFVSDNGIWEHREFCEELRTRGIAVLASPPRERK